MTSLPPGQDSVLGALDHAAPSRPLPQGFDWGALVTAARPGNATPAQRQQAERFGDIQSLLQRWGERFGLLKSHVQASAVFAVTATPMSSPLPSTLLPAKLIYWIYCLDSLLDKRDLRQPGVMAMIDADLLAVTRPLRGRVTQKIPSDEWADTGEAMSPLARGLHAALGDFFAEADEQWRGMPGTGWDQRYRQLLIVRQLATCVGAMKQEIWWSYAALHSSKHEPPPTVASYLAIAERSIGVHPIAAIITAFCPQPRQVWRDHSQGIALAATVIRLTNDMHTYAIDLQERHLSAMTLLRHDPLTPESEVAARAELRRRLHVALAGFVHHIETCAETALTYFLTHIVAFSLAIYGDGA